MKKIIMASILSCLVMFSISASSASGDMTYIYPKNRAVVINLNTKRVTTYRWEGLKNNWVLMRRYKIRQDPNTHRYLIGETTRRGGVSCDLCIGKRGK